MAKMEAEFEVFKQGWKIFQKIEKVFILQIIKNLISSDNYLSQIQKRSQGDVQYKGRGNSLVTGTLNKINNIYNFY